MEPLEKYPVSSFDVYPGTNAPVYDWSEMETSLHPFHIYLHWLKVCS